MQIRSFLPVFLATTQINSVAAGFMQQFAVTEPEELAGLQFDADGVVIAAAAECSMQIGDSVLQVDGEAVVKNSSSFDACLRDLVEKRLARDGSAVIG